MFKRFALLLLGVLLALVALAAPAQAATRPVTVTATSTCVYARWEVTLTVTSTTARTADIYGDGDTGNRVAVDLNGVPQLGISLAANVPYVVKTQPGESNLYVEYGIFRVGSLGWDRGTDPTAWVTAYPPNRTNPRATC